MKKLFTLAFAFALIVGCAKEEKVSIASPEAVSTGDAISFVVDNETATKAEWIGDYKAGEKISTSWYSEEDYLGVVFADAAWNDKGANSKVQPLAVLSATTWGGASAFGGGEANEVTGAQAYTNPWGWATTAQWSVAGSAQPMAKMVFKATRNESNGVFTAANNDNRLYFPSTTRGTDPVVLVDPSFLVYYPSSLTPNFDANNTDPAADDAKIKITVKAGVSNIQTQGLDNGSDSWAMINGLVLNADPSLDFLVDNTAENRAANSSVKMNLQRQYAVAMFSTENFNSLFGKFKSVQLLIDDATVALAYSEAPTVTISALNANGDYDVTGGALANSITLSAASGSELEAWDDESVAYMAINPFKWNTTKKLNVRWEFENTSIAKEVKLASPVAEYSFLKNEFYGLQTLDVDELPYYCLKEGGVYTTLVINEICTKPLDEIIPAAVVIWPDVVNATDITKFICHKQLSVTELEVAKAKLTNVKEYTLANTSESLGTDLANIVTTAATPTSLTLTKAVNAPTITSSMTALTYIKLDVATSIKDNAFRDNVVLTDVIIPNVDNIGANAFSGCSLLDNVDARKATHLGPFAFANCDKLVKIGVSTTTPATDNIFLDALVEIGEQAFSEIAGIVSINLPELTTIKTKAFQGSTSATTGTTIAAAKLPVGGVAFDAFGLSVSPFNPYLENITELWLPSYDYTQETVRNQLVQKSHLTKIDLSAVNEIKKVVDGTSNILNFDGYDKLVKVVLKPGVKVGYKAFNGCSLLNDILIENASLIGDEAFAGCNALTNVTINLSAENPSLGKYAFYGANGLISVTFGPDVTSIGDAAFQTAGATSFNVDINNVTNIGEAAFNSSTVLGINLNNVTTLGVEAFKNCTKLEGVYDSERGKNVIYLGASSVPESAFEGCTQVDIYDLTAEEVTIGSKAFRDAMGTKIINFKHSNGNAIITNFDFINIYNSVSNPTDWTEDSPSGYYYIMNFSGKLNGIDDKSNIVPNNKIVIKDADGKDNTITLTGVYKK